MGIDRNLLQMIRTAPLPTWLVLAASVVVLLFLLVLLWKILRSEEGFLFSYGNWVVGKWQPGRAGAGGAQAPNRPVPNKSSPERLPPDIGMEQVLTLSRLLDTDLANLLISEEWEPRMEKALQTIVSGVARVVGPAGRCRCGFFMLEEAEQVLVLIAGEGHFGGRRPSLALDHSCAGRAFLTGEDYYCRDIETDPVYWHSARGRNDYRSIACVPVRAGRSVFGVLCLDAPEPNAFAATDFLYLSVFAAKLAVFCAFKSLQASGVCRLELARNATPDDGAQAD